MDPIDNYTKEELYALAREYQIKGRSKMRKAELYDSIALAPEQILNRRIDALKPTFYALLRSERQALISCLKSCDEPFSLRDQSIRIPVLTKHGTWKCTYHKVSPKASEKERWQGSVFHGHLVAMSLPRAVAGMLETLFRPFSPFRELRLLSLKSCYLKRLPEVVCQLTNLEELNLAYNKLSTLPEAIGQLKSLEKLDLRYNKLSTLPESLGHLKNLKELYLQENQLSTLPESFGQLTNLKILSLHVNQLSTLPEALENWIRDLKKKGCNVWR